QTFKAIGNKALNIQAGDLHLAGTNTWVPFPRARLRSRSPGMTIVGVSVAALFVTSIAFAQPHGAPRPLQSPQPQATAPAQSANALPTPDTTTPIAPGSNATLIQHGHLYTVGDAGTIADGDVLISGGKIVQVGPNLTPPDGAKIINARGKPVTPG